jgi:mannose-6-phosphate isomerase-like protein (cupin superfamily)
MNIDDFKADLIREGYRPRFSSQLPDHAAPDHAHDFDARVMVLGGEITITRDGKPETFRTGDSCSVPSGCMHAEHVGPEGVAYLAGRRDAA